MTSDEIEQRDALAAQLAGARAMHDTASSVWEMAMVESGKVIEGLRVALAASAVTIETQRKANEALKAAGREMGDAVIRVWDAEDAYRSGEGDNAIADECEFAKSWLHALMVRLAALVAVDEIAARIDESN